MRSSLMRLIFSNNSIHYIFYSVLLSTLIPGTTRLVLYASIHSKNTKLKFCNCPVRVYVSMNTPRQVSISFCYQGWKKSNALFRSQHLSVVRYRRRRRRLPCDLKTTAFIPTSKPLDCIKDLHQFVDSLHF